MKNLRSLVGLYLLACCTTLVMAETGYVVDQLLVGVREGKNVTDKLLMVLPTGEQLKILETEGDFSRVQALDGTKGWVESAYLTSNPPAASLVPELQNRISVLNRQLNELESTGSSPKSSLGSSLAVTGTLRDSWIYAGGSGLLALLIGFAAGYYQRSKKESRRLSGMRV